MPRFQRSYSWTKEEISELWNDILLHIIVENQQIKNLEYFIGPLVLIDEGNSTDLQIVDGQQRLTTITILLSALVQTFKECNQIDLAKDIYHTYIEGKEDDGKPYFKLIHETLNHCCRYPSNIWINRPST